MAVSISANPTVLVEEEGTVLTITLNSDEPIPEGGLVVTVDSETENALAQLDVFATEFENLRLVGVNDDTSGFSIRLTEQTGTLSLPIFDDDVADAIEGLTFTVQPGEGYTVDESASSISLTLLDAETATPEPPPDVPEVPVDPIPSENTPPVAQSDSYTVEAGEELSVDVDSGILANDSDAEGNQLIVSILDTPDSGNLSLSEDGSFSYTPNDGFSGTDTFTYLINDGEIFSEPATVEITVEAGTPTEGGEGGEGGEAGTPTEGGEGGEGGEAGTPTEGGEGGEGGEPTVSFSTTPAVINEAEGTALVMNFSVDGEIPEDGITVDLEGDTAGILQQFTVAQTRFDSETGGIFYRFDTGFAENANGNIVGGTLNRFSLEDGDPSETASNEAAAGTGFLSDFSFTITEENASLTLPVLDDIIEEADTTYTYTLVDGDGYAVNPEANSDTFTVTDGVPGGVGPTVGVTATPSELIESEQTVVKLDFTTQGEIPSDGLVVLLEGPPRAISEFDVNATNPRLPEEETEVTGLEVTGGSIVGTNETAGALFFRITESNATIEVPVFQDDVAEGTESLTFDLRNGELYEVDANASSITLTIEDESSTPDPTPDPTPPATPEFGTINADIIEVEGSGQIVFGGSESDLIDASIGSEGGNRIYAGSGDDTLILGNGDRLVGGAGDDKFFAMSGGDNIITGGEGADQFWIATAETPDSANIITDFTSGEDVLGIAGLGIGFDDLSITAQDDNTLIAANNSELAILQGIGADSLIADNFAFG